jgi:hypothetical protein
VAITATSLQEGDKVRVYRNLRGPKGKRLYSVLGPSGRVVARVEAILLTDVKFVVRPAGRDKVRREGRKNVHAFVVGTYSESAMGQDALGPDLPCRVTYNPYENDHFQGRVVGCPWRSVGGAMAVLLNQHGVTAAYTYDLD